MSDTIIQHRWGDYLPTQNMDAEQAVLGCILIEDEYALPIVQGLLQPGDFYGDMNRVIYTAMLSAADKGLRIDMLSVEDELRVLVGPGGDAANWFLRLRSLMDAPAATTLVEHYCQLVAEKALLRQVYASAERLADAVVRNEAGAGEVVALAQHLLGGIQLRGRKAEMEYLADLIRAEIVDAKLRMERGEAMTGTPTPFDDLDYYTQGLQAGDFVLIAARPSMGKSAMAFQFLVEAARKTGKPALCFSLEMSKSQVAQRILCTEARVDAQRFRRGVLTQEEWDRLAYCADELCRLPVYIDDSKGLSVAEMRMRAEEMHRKQPVGLLVVDYLQEIRSPGRSGNRGQELGVVSRDLKILAGTLKCPVVALSQLSRAVEQRPDKRPILSDLKDSGDIEAVADLVMMLYRASYYKQGKEESEDLSQVEEAEIIIAKQRNGPVGVVNVAFIPYFACFETIDHHHASAQNSETSGEDYAYNSSVSAATPEEAQAVRDALSFFEGEGEHWDES